MNIDPQTLYTALHDMRQEATDRHIEVVQRLTALETRINESPTTEIEKRVRKLERWKNTAAGISIALNMAVVGAFEWISSHTK